MENKANVPSKLNDYGFGKLALKCVSCTETDKKDGFILKLQHQHLIEKVTPFGKKSQPVQHTFYMKVAESCAVDFTAEMNLDEWKITERPFEFTDEDSVVQNVNLKWLHLAE